MNFNPTVDAYLDQAPEDQKETLLRLRLLVHQTVAGVSEEIKWGFPVFAKTKDFAYLRSTKKHITLGFYHIDRLEDPDQLLEGSGNTWP